MKTDFGSILFARINDRSTIPLAPVFFRDLNLDQIVDAITLGRQEYDLTSFFYVPLHEVSAVEYRHGVMRDLEGAALFGSVQAFSARLRSLARLAGPRRFAAPSFGR